MGSRLDMDGHCDSGPARARTPRATRSRAPRATLLGPPARWRVMGCVTVTTLNALNEYMHLPELLRNPSSSTLPVPQMMDPWSGYSTSSLVSVQPLTLSWGPAHVGLCEDSWCCARRRSGCRSLDIFSCATCRVPRGKDLTNTERLDSGRVSFWVCF